MIESAARQVGLFIPAGGEKKGGAYGLARLMEWNAGLPPYDPESDDADKDPALVAFDKAAKALPVHSDEFSRFPDVRAKSDSILRLSMPDADGTPKSYEPVDQDAMNGTSKEGELKMSEADLIRVFGEPSMDASLDGKVSMGWVFRTIAGDVFTIYDWKGFRWSIGGHSGAAVQAVSDALEAAGVEKRYESPDNMNVGGRIVVAGGDVRFSMPDGAVAARKAADEGAGGRPLPLGDLADQMRERARIAAAALKAENNNYKRQAWETIRHESNNILRSIREMEEAYKTAGADYPTARYSMPDGAAGPLDGYKPTTSVAGTCRRGCLRGVDGAVLMHIFGASHYAGDLMWAFTNAAGEVFTVYEYKGERWSIGGGDNSRIAVDMVHGILRAAGVDCKRRDMLLLDKPYEPVIYVGDLPELPCDAYTWAPVSAPDAPLVSVLKAIRALLVSGWNPQSRGFAINSRGECCHSRDKNMKTMCFAAAMSMAEARERRGTAAERDGRYNAIYKAVHKGAGLAPLSDDAPTSALTGAIECWENAEGRTQGDILYALDAAIAGAVERQQQAGVAPPRFSMPDAGEKAALRRARVRDIAEELCRRGNILVAQGGEAERKAADAFRTALTAVEIAEAHVDRLPAGVRELLTDASPAKPNENKQQAARALEEAIGMLKWSIRRPRGGECVAERAERIIKEFADKNPGSLDATIRENIRTALDNYRRAVKAEQEACPRFSMPEVASASAGAIAVGHFPRRCARARPVQAAHSGGRALQRPVPLSRLDRIASHFACPSAGENNELCRARRNKWRVWRLHCRHSGQEADRRYYAGLFQFGWGG